MVPILWQVVEEALKALSLAEPQSLDLQLSGKEPSTTLQRGTWGPTSDPSMWVLHQANGAHPISSSVFYSCAGACLPASWLGSTCTSIWRWKAGRIRTECGATLNMQTKKAGTRDMAVIKFTPGSDQQDVKHYTALLARVHIPCIVCVSADLCFSKNVSEFLPNHTALSSSKGWGMGGARARFMTRKVASRWLLVT